MPTAYTYREPHHSLHCHLRGPRYIRSQLAAIRERRFEAPRRVQSLRQTETSFCPTEEPDVAQSHADHLEQVDCVT